MGSTRWADTSEHRRPALNDEYQGRWWAGRVNDGTYRDQVWPASDAHLRTAHGRRLTGYIAYLVWPRSEGHCSWREAADTFTDMLGPRRRRRLVIMQDVEDWGRPELARDHSTDLEAQRVHLVNWLHAQRPGWQRSRLLDRWYLDRDDRRVGGYGNAGNLAVMAPHVRWRWLILAAYVRTEPTHPAHIAWQYTDRGRMAPWTNVDLNVAHIGPRRLARRLGLGVLRFRLR